MARSLDSYKTRDTLEVEGRPYKYYSLARLKAAGIGSIARLPYSIRILLENLLQYEDGRLVTKEDIATVAAGVSGKEIAFRPARVLLQDFTGVPAVADLAAMRNAMVRLGGDPQKINPLQPADLVIDHSVQVDRAGTADAFAYNSKLEFERNQERYVFLRWGQSAFQNFRVVPPETGIVHQVNLEYLGQVVFTRDDEGETLAYSDTVVGTDSHTTMINGLGIVGWGVGGIEAEAAMLGRPISMLIPEVIGFRLTGELPAGATATDMVLTVTQMLREKGVVGKFVEFFGPSLATLSLPDRATISNMAPEYGATIGFFPVDEKTIEYLQLTGRDPDQIALTESYTRAQDLYYSQENPEPAYNDVLTLDLSTVHSSLAGPRRPQDRVALPDVGDNFRSSVADFLQVPPKEAAGRLGTEIEIKRNGDSFALKHGAVVIAAITSCTNTSNPNVMIAAGMLAKRAAELGLRSRPWVKTSLAPGSKVVTEYLKEAGLLRPLEKLGFHVVGYGCTTCIGNSGPLAPDIAGAILEHDLVVSSVLSGNRNFEGRISPIVKASYLASPPLVVAYALAGTINIDLEKEPLGEGADGEPVYLHEIWPTLDEVREVVSESVKAEQYLSKYADVFSGKENWKAIPQIEGDLFDWSDDSTYIKEPPFFQGMSVDPDPPADITGGRALAVLGDSVTTDHISPAGAIPEDGPAGRYLIELGVKPADFNSFGSRRGNHEVMVRGTFANVRLRNRLAKGKEGGWTRHLPGSEVISIFDAAMKYADEKTPLFILAGKEYGTGSSRDWAGKGPMLLGIRAVIAESYERIHRSNLVGMGVLPLQFVDGGSVDSLGLTGEETFHVRGIAENLTPGSRLEVEAVDDSGIARTFPVLLRIDTPDEIDYYKNGGILNYVLRTML